MISNWKVFAIEDSIKASKYPKSTDVDNCTPEITNTVRKLAGCDTGTGHDQFLTGIIVQFDLTFTVKAWTEAERYHFFDLVSSQSTMHKITEFDLDSAYIEYVDPRKLATDKERLDEQEKANAVIFRALYAQINHEISGNGDEILRRSRDEIQDYLTNR